MTGQIGRARRDDRDPTAAETSDCAARRPRAPRRPRSPFQATSEPPARAAGTRARPARRAVPTARARTAGQRPRWPGSAARSSARLASTDDPSARAPSPRRPSRGTTPSCRSTRRGAPARRAARPRSGCPGSRRRCRCRRTPGSEPAQLGDRGEAVDHVPPGDLRRIPDGGQVDRGVPGDQQADVAVDGVAGAGRRGRRRASRRPASSASREVGREVRNVPNARRERITRTVQALLLSVVPTRAVRAPLPASFFAPLVVLRSSRAGPVRGRVSPCPSPVPLPE